MFKILIVDDERIEREGIISLIVKYNIPLEVSEAKNGEEALDFLKKNHVDIIITDIKMPFMDGLDLSHEALKVNPKIKTIIFSAYGEFEYAKKALENKIISYLLKPIDIEEFLYVINDVINLCKTEFEEEEKKKEFRDKYEKVALYEKKNCLMNLVNYENIDNDLEKRIEACQMEFNFSSTLLLMIDTKKKLFDKKSDEVEELIGQITNLNYEYLNFNEYQSMLFINYYYGVYDRDLLKKIGDTIVYEFENRYGIKPILIYSKKIIELNDFHNEYRIIEQILEMKFFFQDGAILFSGDKFQSDTLSENEIDDMIKDIFKFVDLGMIDQANINIRTLFRKIKDDKSYTVEYVKYLCVEILKRKIDIVSNTGENKYFNKKIKRIFSINNIMELEQEAIKLIEYKDGINTSEGKSTKNVVNDVIEIIQKDYMTDISLEYISEKVFLSTSYLSYLFKLHTGQSLIKYITDYRLKQAKKLLDDTNMKVIDIGISVGYHNLSYFCMLFKNHYGNTPAKYRERN